MWSLCGKGIRHSVKRSTCERVSADGLWHALMHAPRGDLDVHMHVWYDRHILCCYQSFTLYMGIANGPSGAVLSLQGLAVAI